MELWLFCSLITHFEADASKVLALEKGKRKSSFLLLFARLLRTLRLTPRRYSRSKKEKENPVFFCFLLAYSYLCSE